MQQSKSENPVAKAYTVSPSKSISSALVSDLQKSGYIRKNFDDLNLNKCIGRLVYGTEIMRVDKKRTDKPKRALFYILETDLTKLKWISLKTGKTKHILDLTTVSNVSELPFYLSKAIKKYDPSQVLSVQYSHGKELVLIFEDSVKKREWWCGLQYFIEEIHKFGSDATALPTMKEIAHHFFMSADLDGTKTLDKKEVKKLLNKLQIYVKKSEIKLLFEKYDANKNDKIEITEFENFMTELFRKEELVPIFQKYASAYVANDCENPTMSLNDLMKFFEEQQHQPITLETARKIHPSFKDVSMMKPCISFDFFGTIIFSLMNTIFNPERSYIYQDMTRPLTDYYINSSHNTYLMSNQLTGESSILAYINALNKGCRCVELDIWTGPNSTPIIYHGHTMTTKILFEDVIKAIHEHAFANSQYPLILSFENHCDLKTQEKMVEILKNEIGDLIYPVPDNFEDFKFYPSPEELMGKIIIKGTSMLKRGNEQQPQQELDNGIEEDSDTDEKSLIPEKSVVNEKSLETFGNMSELLETSEKPSAMARYATPIKKVPNSGRARRPLNENVLHSSDSEGEGDGSGRSKSSVGKQRINTAISSIRTPSQKVHGLQVNTFEIRKNSSQPIQKDLSAPLPSKMKIDIQQASGSIGDDIVAFKSAEGTPKPTTDTKDVKDIIGSKKFLELDDIIVSHTHLNGNNNIKESKTAYVIPNRDLESPTKIVPLSEDLAKKEEKNAKAAQTKNAIKATKRDSEFASNSQLDVDLNDLCKSIPMLGGKKESQFAGRNNDPSSRKGTYKASDHATKHDHHKKAQTVKVLPELGAMYAMIGRHMHFDDKRTVWEISSLNESKIAKLFKTQYKKIIDFHKSFLSRIYPLGSRIDSSNYEPTIGWAAGSQIVALNFQKSDEPMLLNYAKFLANGGIKNGYILKPEYMRHESLTNKELVQYPDFKKPLKKLTVRVISGQQIRPDNFVINQVVDPFIEVKIKGLEIDEHNNGVFRTHTNKDNGFHPTWSTEEDKVKQKFEFLIHAPDFCTLVFTAYHGEVLKKDKMGWYAIEFNNIQQGYRVVPLLNNLFQPIKNSYVFCKISITDI